MKQPKKPTLEQKKIMSKSGLDWKTWNVAYEDETSIHLVSKKSGQNRTVKK